MQIKAIKNKNMKWWVGIISCVALFSIIMVFSYEKMIFMVKGVKIDAKIEQSNDSPLAIVSGTAEKATYISLNGREIFIDKEGNFSESIVMLPGFSVVTLSAKDKFGMTAEKKFEMITEESAPAVAMN